MDMHMNHSAHDMDHSSHVGHNMQSGHGNHAEHAAAGNATDHGSPHDMMGGGHSMMQMSFHLRLLGDTVLFDFWQIDQTSKLATSLFIIFLMGIFKEFLACWRRRRRQMRREEEAMQRYGRWHSIAHSLVDSALYMTQVMVSYFLMLIAMTYNGWLFMAVLLGLGFGYLLFMSGPDRRYGSENSDKNSDDHRSSTSVMDVEDCCD